MHSPNWSCTIVLLPFDLFDLDAEKPASKLFENRARDT